MILLHWRTDQAGLLCLGPPSEDTGISYLFRFLPGKGDLAETEDFLFQMYICDEVPVSWCPVCQERARELERLEGLSR